MAIFGFGKKEDNKTAAGNTFSGKTAMSRVLAESNKDEFVEPSGQIRPTPSVITEPVKSMPSAPIDLDIPAFKPMNLEPLGEKVEPKFNSNLDDFDDISDSIKVEFNDVLPKEKPVDKLDLGRIGDFDIDKIRNEVFKSSPVTDFKPTNIVPEVKKEEKKEEQKEFSGIMDRTLSRAIAICFDLVDRYAKDKTYRLDIRSTNADLSNFVNANPNIIYLDASNCPNIDDFSKIGSLTKLEELDLSGCLGLTNFSFLSGLRNLRVLNLGETGIESLAGFPLLPNLQVLNIKMNKIKNLNGLEVCRGLHDIVLWGCGGLENINAVANFTELRSLDLDSCAAIKDLSPIANLLSLMYLNLNFTRIEDLSPIRNLTNLEVFTMDFSPMAMAESNLVYFERLVKMKFLGLSNRLIRNLYYFRNMTELAELELAGNAVSDLSPLENMTKMQILNLSSNPSLVNLAPLYKMSKLKKLLISGLKTGKEISIAMLIEDISVVKNFTDLEVFESNANKKIRDVSALQFCSKLEEVHLNDCLFVTDITALVACKNLMEINIENCTQIRDISFVKYCPKIENINIAKTSVDRIALSDLSTFTELRGVKDGEGTLPIHKNIITSLKYRKKITKISKKTIKDDKK